jgi:hypothetical protein
LTIFLILTFCGLNFSQKPQTIEPPPLFEFHIRQQLKDGSFVVFASRFSAKIREQKILSCLLLKAFHASNYSGNRKISQKLNTASSNFRLARRLLRAGFCL